MSRLEIYKKQAKQLVRWHREGNHSIGGRIRGLARYKTLTDREALALTFPLREAQEIIAVEAGHESWAALKAAVANEPTPARRVSSTPRLTRAVPIIFVANVQASAEFFRDTLGFSIDFLHGHPAFLRRRLARRRLRASEIRARARVRHRYPRPRRINHGLHRSGERQGALCTYLAAGVMFDQKLKKQAWGGRDFIVRDLDGNGICFVGSNV